MTLDLEPNPQNVFFRCVEDSNDAIMISDIRGSLVYVNPAWSRIYGYTREEAIGQNPKLLHSGHHSPEFYQHMWASIRDHATGHWKGELINRSKDGALVPVLLTITPFRGHSGEISGYMGIAVDISYRKELEAKVAHQDRLASIGMLASGLAHEVGTPLGVIRGRAEFLMMQAENPAIKKNLEVITSQIDRISKLIRSLLRVSRAFSDVQLEDISVNAVISEVLSLVGQNVREDSVDLRVSVPDEIHAHADFGRLEQIMLNLVMNSIHAIRKAIRDGRHEGHFLSIQASREGNRIIISVEDTGCGIAPQDMQKLFRPFFTTKDVGEGTGLGLAIVAQLVHEIKAEISVESHVDRGTKFSISLQA